MTTAGIEVRRLTPTVATVWVAELLAAANRQADELENRKTHESIQQMFGKITSSPSNPKLSFEEMLCNKITKQKKKNEEKEKEYQMTVKSKKTKKELTNGVSKTEYISDKKKTSMLGNEKKIISTVESIKSRLEDQSISRSARKKLKRKLKELQSNRETEQQDIARQDRKKFKLLKNKTEVSSLVQKKKTSLSNGHQPDISTTLTSGNQECKTGTIINGFKINTTMHLSTKHEGQPDEGDLQLSSKKSKLAKQIDKLSELLKKKKKKRSKQKNIKKDKRPDHMKPPHLKIKTIN